MREKWSTSEPRILAATSILWWVEYGGVHLGGATLPGMYSAQVAGGHYILVIPTLNMVIVNQFDNEPKSHEPAPVLKAAQDRHAIFNDQFVNLWA